MSRRNQMIALGLLLPVLGVTLYFTFRPSADSVKATAGSALFTPINVDNPALRLDILQHFLSLEYKGAHRNIFVATLPPLRRCLHPWRRHMWRLHPPPALRL